MSEDSLRRFLDRFNEDAAFRESVQQDPAHALEEFELSPVERVALATNDEDSLRRLAGADVAAFGVSGPGGFPTLAVPCPSNALGFCSLPCQAPVAIPATKGADCAHPASIGESPCALHP